MKSGNPSPLNVANVISKVIFVESATLISSHPGFNSPLVTINSEPLNSPSTNSRASSWVNVSNPNGVTLAPFQL